VNLARRYEADQIAARVSEVAGALDRDFRQDPLVLISILKGSSFFMADLARRLSVPVSCEYIAVRREEDAHETLRIDFSTGFSVAGRPVLLLKDVVYSGVVENYLMDHLRASGARSVGLAAILDKPRERKTAISVEFSLFSTEGGTFVGYGMDYRGSYAHLPYVAEVLEEQ